MRDQCKPDDRGPDTVRRERGGSVLDRSGSGRRGEVVLGERAGVSRATLFRHLTDKREALFLDQQRLHDLLRDGASGARARSTALTVVGSALDSIAIAFDEARRPEATRRRAAVAAAPELQERSALKHTGLVRTLREALLERGVPPAEAEVAATIGLRAFGPAHERWADPREAGDFRALLDEEFAALRDALASLARRSR